MRNRARTAMIPGWHPPRITVEVVARTTATKHSTNGIFPSDDACLSPAGTPLGVVAGQGTDPASAVRQMCEHARAELNGRARQLISEHTERAADAVKAGRQPPAYQVLTMNDQPVGVHDTFEWYCEVIDARITAGAPGWAAYGTLVSSTPDPVWYGSSPPEIP
jgi:hypothetical protein